MSYLRVLGCRILSPMGGPWTRVFVVMKKGHIRANSEPRWAGRDPPEHDWYVHGHEKSPISQPTQHPN